MVVSYSIMIYSVIQNIMYHANVHRANFVCVLGRTRCNFPLNNFNHVLTTRQPVKNWGEKFFNHGRLKYFNHVLTTKNWYVCSKMHGRLKAGESRLEIQKRARMQQNAWPIKAG